MTEHNEGIIISGGSFSSKQTVVGSNAQGIQQTYNIDNEHKSLAEAAAEIQQLLKQLEQSNPTATDAEKIYYVNGGTTLEFKRRAVSALQAGGEAAIEAFLDNPYVNIGKAIVKGWVKPD